MVSINFTLILRGVYAFAGLFVFLTGLIHLCVSGWKGWSVHGVQSNASVVCGFIAILLMINGIYMILSPFVMYIPVAKDYANFWNLYTSVAWLIITGIVTLFFTGFFGLTTSIICWLVSIFAIVLSVLSCLRPDTQERDNDKDDEKDPYNV
ncbi:hypothetical protein EIN_080820 [Entamoeba invadens IP1]|uniref:hypothetical protein n=1 Tax=Entamoeba invadens IP1 TaxID=370355 RepID=UPI0002C3F632|nr:hypothetical protein EIN_080820 [Entamoeba invadens IP1]ELP85110.1 hypothetical protein EIN_080820 [Entamoeba invadens IP1]|eukprot:XP_004184456.1 hypothetical protein EIN_080820 [Entamoeba invadens IP1]